MSDIPPTKQDRSSPKSRRLARRSLREDESGIAALEFALIAPLIIGVYLGLAELAMVLKIERQVSHSASVAGDLATQVPNLELSDVEDLVSATLRVASVPDLKRYTLHLESFERDADGNVQSLGEIVYNSAGSSALPDFDATSLGFDVVSEQSGVVVARVAATYSPMGQKNTLTSAKADTFLPGLITLRETFLLKPRRSIVVKVGEKTGTKMSCDGKINAVTCTASGPGKAKG